MAKQKKKSTQINSLDKSVGRMAGIDTHNPAEFRRCMDTFKERYRDYAEALGLTEDPTQPPQNTWESRRLLRCACTDGTLAEYISVVRALLIGHWLSHRVIYTFTPEALDFIDNTLRIQDFGINMRILQEVALRQPIYIETPAGSPVPKAFMGRVAFFHDEIVGKKKPHPSEFCCYTNLDIDRGCYAALSMSANDSVHDAMQPQGRDKDEYGAELAFVLKLVAYIGYMRVLQDAGPLTFIEEPIRNGVRYRVRPIHTDSILSDETTPNGWVRAGLAPIMGYFDRKNMLRDFQRESGKHPSQVEIRAGEEDSAAVLLRRMTLKWESQRNIYSFSSDIAMCIAQDAAKPLMSEGISSDLLEYMPYQVIVLVPEDSAIFSAAMVTRCTLEGGRSGIFVSILGRGNCPDTFCCPENEPLMDGDEVRCLEDIGADILLSLCLFSHILQVLKTKTLRRIGDRKESTPQPPRAPSENQVPEAPVVRQGGDISDTVPIAMFDLTKRTVKRVTQKEAARRGGWRMIPHVRRRHPHRYWVGKGADKHLEIRWLESMNINRQREEDTHSVTVHNVGL